MVLRDEESRMDWGPSDRIRLAQDREKIILLLGGETKRGMQKEIEQAVRLRENDKKRKAKGTKKSLTDDPLTMEGLLFGNIPHFQDR